MSSSANPKISPLNKFSSIKIVLVGPSNAGKTSIAKRFTTDTFDEYQDMTVGSAFFSKQVQSRRFNQTVRVEVWDTAGQEKFRSVAPMYFRNAAGALLVFDLTSPKSFEECETVWLPELLPHFHNSTQFICMCGNKMDLVSALSGSGSVGDQQGTASPGASLDESTNEGVAFIAKVEMLTTSRGLQYFPTSAKKGRNIDAVFSYLVDEVLEARSHIGENQPLLTAPAATLLSTPDTREEERKLKNKKGQGKTNPNCGCGT